VRTNLLAKRLKTLGLHKNGTLDSQFESRKYEGWCRDVNGPKVILASHSAIRIGNCVAARHAEIGCGKVDMALDFGWRAVHRCDNSFVFRVGFTSAEKSVLSLILGGAAVHRCDTQHSLELRLYSR
jgi:hypothetical protein